jgi:hypothetical protein
MHPTVTSSNTIIEAVFFSIMGNSRRAKEFPYLMHISTEIPGGDLKKGDNYVYEDGRITTADHPKVNSNLRLIHDFRGPSPPS